MNIDRIKNINTKYLGKNFIYYDEISSTHNFASQNIDSFEHGSVLFANKQTSGIRN